MTGGAGIFELAKAALSVVAILFLVAAPLWQARRKLRGWHLAVLWGVTAALAAFTQQLRDTVLLYLLGGALTALASAALLLAIVFMAIGRNSPPPDDDIAIDPSLKVRAGEADLGRTYAVPQVIALVAAGWLIETRLSVVPLVAAAIFAALSWVAAQRRLRAIAQTPTSRIASAAQGYVELIGRGRPLGKAPLASPLRKTPCLWFSYRIEEKRGKNWKTIEHATSEEPFELDDGSGVCVVEPSRAHVQTGHKAVWRDGKRQYTEEWLRPKDRLYVLGTFASENPAARSLDARREVGALLAQWKRDPLALRERFDADNDGEVGLAEWPAVQREARAQVEAELAAARALPATHFVRAPGDHRPFVICNGQEPDVMRKVRRSALIRMAWFGVLLGAAAYGATRPNAEGRARGAAVRAKR